MLEIAIQHAPLLAGLPPVLNSNTRVLILGSFPGAASLGAQQYYAHPRNQFWRLMSVLSGANLMALPYAARVQCLLVHEFGLWDVLGACERVGSLDANIRNAKENDFALLRQRCPALRRVGFNGKTAGKSAPQFAEAGFDTVVLPSSSPAHATLSFEEKLSVWRRLSLR